MSRQVKHEDPSRLGVAFLLAIGVLTLIFTWKDVVIGWLSISADEERLVKWSPPMAVPVLGALVALFCFATAIVVVAITRSRRAQ